MKRGRKTQQENFKKREKEENEKDTIDRTESKVLPLLFIIEWKGGIWNHNIKIHRNTQNKVAPQ